MPLPNHLVLVRHGQSESNYVQKSEPDFQIPDAFFERHDSLARLTELGIEQARIAGEWLKDNGYKFDKFFVSPHLRTRETAANLRLGGRWIIDDLWRERDWGEYGMIPRESIQEERFPYSFLLKKQNPWYWHPTGGESLATGVRYRVNAVLERLAAHKVGDEAVIGVTHGEFIRTMQFVLERLTPEEWVELDENKDLSIRNCMVLHYTRLNPDTGEQYHRYKWVKQVNTHAPNKSPYGGERRELETTLFSDDDLLNSIEPHPPLFR